MHDIPARARECHTRRTPPMARYLPQVTTGRACGVCAIIPLARLFTAEYAGLFDVLLPGLSERKLPLPLGGSADPFRTPVLRRVNGLDPYNVTEDADLGMRLARLGFATTVIGSTTYEEAPAHVRPWIRQRTRWFKGWMQTWLVHMRDPARIARELGFGGFAAFQLVVALLAVAKAGGG